MTGIYKCYDCENGYSCNGIKQEKCREGSFGMGGVCVSCKKNQYSMKTLGGKYKCLDCDDGYSCNGISRTLCK